MKRLRLCRFSWKLPGCFKKRIPDTIRDEETGLPDEAIHLGFQRRDFTVAFRFQQNAQSAGDPDFQIAGHRPALGFVHYKKIGRPFQGHGDGLRFTRIECGVEDADDRVAGDFMNFDPSFGAGLLQCLFA